MSRSVRYGVQLEFTLDSVLEGGPSKAEIRQQCREQIQALKEMGLSRWGSLRDVRVKYLHEASSTKEKK